MRVAVKSLSVRGCEMLPVAFFEEPSVQKGAMPTWDKVIIFLLTYKAIQSTRFQ